MKYQEYLLNNKPEIIVATPGRLIDIILNSKSIELGNIETLILDEADKLLEMGFKESILQILKILQEQSDIENWQTILLSATLSKEIKELSDLALKNPSVVQEEK